MAGNRIGFRLCRRQDYFRCRWPVTERAVQSPTLIEAYNRHNTLSQQGQYSEAIPYAREALRLGEEEFGPDHPATAIFLNNLALLYKAQGNYAEQGLNLKDQGKCLRDAERISWRWAAFAICQMVNNRMSLVGTLPKFRGATF